MISILYRYIYIKCLKWQKILAAPSVFFKVTVGITTWEKSQLRKKSWNLYLWSVIKGNGTLKGKVKSTNYDGVLNYNQKFFSNVIIIEYKNNEGYYDYLNIWGQPFILHVQLQQKWTEREDLFYYLKKKFNQSKMMLSVNSYTLLTSLLANYKLNIK